jgi:PAS domain S-box-containing protein
MNRCHDRLSASLRYRSFRTDPLFPPLESLPDVAAFALDPAGRTVRWTGRVGCSLRFPIGGLCGPNTARPNARAEPDRSRAGRGPADRHAREGFDGAERGRTAELLQAIVDSTTDAVFVKDRDGRYLLANPATARFVGRPAPDIIGRTDEELFDPESARWVMERDRQVMARGCAETEEEALTADGVTRTYLATKAPYRGADGTVVGLIGISRDITERKRAERELVLFRALIDRTTDWIEVIDPETAQFLDVNEEACRAHGYTRAEYLALHLSDIDPLVAARPWAETLEQLSRVGNQPFESRHMGKDGSTFPVEVRVNWVRTERDYMVAVVRDITDRKRNEAALRHTQERLRSVISSSPAVLYTLAAGADRAWHIAWVSDNVRGMLGFAPTEVIGPDWWGAHVHPEDRARAEADGRPELLSDRGAANEYRIRHRDGTYRWVRGEVRLVRDAAGAPVEAVGSWSDVTARKQIEDQFRHAQKMEAVGRLAGGVAHDFNNLLTVINGYAALLLGEMPPTDPRFEPLREIREAGKLAAGLTAQLLAFSRKTIIEPKVLDLNDVVSQSAKLLRRLIGEDVTLATVLAPNLDPVKVDPNQIEQALMNLAVNARDAMPRGGRLTIETRRRVVRAGDSGGPHVAPGRYVQLAVTDTGEGMTEEVRARIFEPFFSTKEVGKGTGLGLATVYGVVKTYGGHISVESELGRGTTFKLLFPAEAEPPRRPAPAEPLAAPRGTETVLLVEDDPRVREVTRVALQRSGYVVLEAECGVRAIQLSEEHPGPIHLLLADVVMPGLGGRAVATAVRARRPDVKVLFMSGYTDDAVVRNGIIEGTDAFLHKPFTPLPLALKVRAVLDG